MSQQNHNRDHPAYHSFISRPPFVASSSNAIELPNPGSTAPTSSNLFSGITFYMNDFQAVLGDPKSTFKEESCKRTRALVTAHGGKFSHTPTESSVTHLLIMTNSRIPNDEVISMSACQAKPIEYLDRVGWANFRLLQRWGMTLLTDKDRLDHYSNRNSRTSTACETGEKVVLKHEWVHDCVKRGAVVGADDNWGGWRCDADRILREHTVFTILVVRGRIIPHAEAGSSYRPTSFRRPKAKALSREQETHRDDRSARYRYLPPPGYSPTSRRSSGSTSSSHGGSGDSYRPRYESASPSRSSFSESSESREPSYLSRRSPAPSYSKEQSPYNPATLPQVEWHPDRAGSMDSDLSLARYQRSGNTPCLTTTSNVTLMSTPITEPPSPIFTRSSRDPRLAAARTRTRACSQSVLDDRTNIDMQQTSQTRRVVSEALVRDSMPLGHEIKPVDPRIAWRKEAQARKIAAVSIRSGAEREPNIQSTESVEAIEEAKTTESPPVASASGFGLVPDVSTYHKDACQISNSPEGCRTEELEQNPISGLSVRTLLNAACNLTVALPSTTLQPGPEVPHGQLEVTLPEPLYSSTLEITDSDLDDLVTEDEGEEIESAFGGADVGGEGDDEWFEILDEMPKSGLAKFPEKKMANIKKPESDDKLDVNTDHQSRSPRSKDEDKEQRQFQSPLPPTPVSILRSLSRSQTPPATTSELKSLYEPRSTSSSSSSRMSQLRHVDPKSAGAFSNPLEMDSKELIANANTNNNSSTAENRKRYFSIMQAMSDVASYHDKRAGHDPGEAEAEAEAEAGKETGGLLKKRTESEISIVQKMNTVATPGQVLE
ncbi:hypothetical protein IAT40_002142 [Kwoniella sp. CBS 6097]